MRFRGSWHAVIAAFLSLPQVAHAGEDFPRILVGVAPLAAYVSAITAGVAPAESLLKPDQEPHDFALSPSQAAMLEKADVIIIADYGMSKPFETLLRKKKNLKVIELTALRSANALPYAEENPWLSQLKHKATDTYGDGEHTKEDEHDHATHTGHTNPNLDPHLWLDPERMAAVAPEVAEALAAIYPSRAETFRQNAAALATHLRSDVIPGMRAMLVPSSEPPSMVYNKPTVPFITYHAAYQYFLLRFGLTHYGQITTQPEERRGAKTMETMLQAAKETRIRCVIAEAETPLVKKITELSSARAVIMSPDQPPLAGARPMVPWIKNDYDLLLYTVSKNFSACL